MERGVDLVGVSLAALRRCDWTTGELMDPTCSVATVEQNADMLLAGNLGIPCSNMAPICVKTPRGVGF
jgi:hypothetical protein